MKRTLLLWIVVCVVLLSPLAALAAHKQPGKPRRARRIVWIAAASVTVLAAGIAAARAGVFQQKYDPAMYEYEAEATPAASAPTQTLEMHAAIQTPDMPDSNAIYLYPSLFIDPDDGSRYYDFTIFARTGSRVILHTVADTTAGLMTVPENDRAILRVAEDVFYPNAPVLADPYIVTPTISVTRPDGREYEVYCAPIEIPLPTVSLSFGNLPDVRDGGTYRTGSPQVVLDGQTDDFLVSVCCDGAWLTVYDGGLFVHTLDLSEKDGFSPDKPFSYPVEIYAERDNCVATMLRFTIEYDPAFGSMQNPSPLPSLALT